MTMKDAENRDRLIVFDVEGVLLPKRRYLLFEVARSLGLWKFVKILLIGMLYEVGLLQLEHALKSIFRHFRGFTMGYLYTLYMRVPWTFGVREVFETLKRAGYRTALISSGIPETFVRDLASRLGADYARGLNLKVVDRRLTGDIGGEVLEPNGKAVVLREIVEREGLSLNDCVVVADDRNNLPMFSLCTLRIGYHPDFVLSAKSDKVVNDDLLEILPAMGLKSPDVSSRAVSGSHTLRETIHIGSFLIPFVCIYVLNRYVVSFSIFVVTMLYLASEVGRILGINFPVVSAITWRAATKPELYEFVTAPLYFASGILFVLLLVPEPINYASIAVLALGDGFATVFGRKFGKTVLPFNKGKSVEGSIFGFLFAFVGAFPFVGLVKALVGAAVGMLMECIPTPVDDNLTIPVVVGLVLMAIPC